MARQVVWLAALLAIGAPSKANELSKGKVAASATVPSRITPEGVAELARSGVGYVLLPVSAAEPARNESGMPIDVRTIYYTSGPSSRLAEDAVARDRHTSAGGAPTTRSQRLTGTPLDWKRAGLAFPQDPLPNRPLFVSPRELSESIKDGVDLQIVDLRPSSPDEPAAAWSHLSKTLHVMPHEFEARVAQVSMDRWVVLVDSGDGIARLLADRLFAMGYALVCVLDGGYPGWVAATDR